MRKIIREKTQQASIIIGSRAAPIILNTDLQHEFLPVCECDLALDRQSLFLWYNGL